MVKNYLPREARPINHATATKHKAFAGVVKLVDTQRLKILFPYGSAGSSPAARTT